MRIGVLWMTSAMWVAAGVEASGPQVPIAPLPTARQLAAAPSFDASQRIVATHYFYWYRWPDEHFFDDDARQDVGIRQHFPDDSQVSYLSADWHLTQFRAMRDAGIDVALPVYWGSPGQYDKPDIAFSVRGLPAIVAALDRLAEQGRPLRVGMFYDTSTLLAIHATGDASRGNVDLRTDEGRERFYVTIRDFFRLVPPRHWACIDGRPIVQLYVSVFAAGHDRRVLEHVYRRFAEDFHGRRPFVIAGPSWSFASQADASVGWGAALHGPIGDGRVMQIGPGYDDAPVPNRSTPVRDRLGGAFYEASWLLALSEKPRIVIIETWNEMHEGTAICPTLEDGRYYVELTRRWSDRFHAGRWPAAGDWPDVMRRVLGGVHANPADRPFASLRSLRWAAGRDLQPVERGLRIVPVADGRFRFVRRKGSPCVTTIRTHWDHRYLYVRVADSYYFDHRGTLWLRFEYLDEGTRPILVQYDSLPGTGPVDGAYREAPRRIERTGSGQWKTAELTLPQARCANRQNGGADLRFVSPGSELAIRRIEVSKLPPGWGR